MSLGILLLRGDHSTISDTSELSKKVLSWWLQTKSASLPMGSLISDSALNSRSTHLLDRCLLVSQFALLTMAAAKTPLHR